MKRFSFRPGLSIKGREFRGLRGFAGKPFHPPLTDVPIGAYVIAPVLDILSFLFPSEAWAPDLHQAAGYVYLGGAAVSLLTALTGFLDWLDTEKGTQIRRMANAHASTMIVMTLLVLWNLWDRYLREPAATADLTTAALGAGILLLAIIGGTIGGSMVYEYGFNVETSTDSPVWHPSEEDIVHPRQT
jgi:uncharacterized membrane protein